MKDKIKNMSKIFIGTKLLKKLNKIHKHLEPYYLKKLEFVKIS